MYPDTNTYFLPQNIRINSVYFHQIESISMFGTIFLMFLPNWRNVIENVLPDDLSHCPQGWVTLTRDGHPCLRLSNNCYVFYILQCLVNPSSHCCIKCDSLHLNHHLARKLFSWHLDLWRLGPLVLLADGDLKDHGHSQVPREHEDHLLDHQVVYHCFPHHIMLQHYHWGSPVLPW